MPILQVSYRSKAYGAETVGPPTLWLSPHSALRMWMFSSRHSGGALDIPVG